MSSTLAHAPVHAPLTTFSLPHRLTATEPPEARGLRRDQVRMLVSRPDGVEHAHFHDLSHILRPGDLVVINTSATRAAAVDGIRAGGEPVVVHYSTRLDNGGWIVELRARDGSGPIRDATEGEIIGLSAQNRLYLVAAHPDTSTGTGSSCGDRKQTLMALSRPGSASTAGRSAMATCVVIGHCPTTRRSLHASLGAQRCQVRRVHSRADS